MTEMTPEQESFARFVAAWVENNMLTELAYDLIVVSPKETP